MKQLVLASGNPGKLRELSVILDESEAIFIPTGYIPARKKPVKKRNVRILVKLLPSQIIPKLNTAPSNAQDINTLEGENRSAMVNMAKISVPMIKPNCTADVKCPNTLSLRSKFTKRSYITAFPANHRDVQQNWEITITGSINLDDCMNNS